MSQSNPPSEAEIQVIQLKQQWEEKSKVITQLKTELADIESQLDQVLPEWAREME